MKKALLIIAAIALMMSCEKGIKRTRIVGTIGTCDIEVVEIDGCEYLSKGTQFTHKGNCKYCADRNKNK